MTEFEHLQNPRFARAYLKVAAESDRRGGGEHRRRLVSGLAGRVLEVGAGQGRNFPYYPEAVDEVVAIEPDATLRAVAARAAARVGRAVTVLPGDAEDLAAEDGEFDAVVFSLVLCTVGSKDASAALAEAARVLRPGGELRFYEHVRSPRRWVGALQDAVTPLWRRAAGGCHPNRDTEAAIGAAGFVIDPGGIDRFGFSPAALAPSATHILGTARKP